MPLICTIFSCGSRLLPLIILFFRSRLCLNHARSVVECWLGGRLLLLVLLVVLGGCGGRGRRLDLLLLLLLQVVHVYLPDIGGRDAIPIHNLIFGVVRPR